MKNPTGILKVKKTVYCEVCSATYKRESKITVYENTDINEAKKELTKKVNKKYTCKVCKSIANSIE